MAFGSIPGTSASIEAASIPGHLRQDWRGNCALVPHCFGGIC